MTLGNKLKMLRAQTQCTQEEIVKKLNAQGVTANRVTLSRWENDEQEPTLTPIMALAKIYNVSSDYLLGLTDNGQSVDKDEESTVYQFAADTGIDFDDLSEESKQQVLDFIRFMKSQEADGDQS